MSGMRNDDFDELEQYRREPEPERKAEREWTGHVAAAFGSEQQAIAVRDCVIANVHSSGSWSGGQAVVSDNILTIWGLVYRARSANANDAEKLIIRCVEEHNNTAAPDDMVALVSDVKVKTQSSQKLGPGR